MSIFGIQGFQAKSNQISDRNIEGLPLPIFRGSLSVSLSFEGHPTGNLVIENISEQELPQYRAVYNQIGSRFVLFGNIFFEIATYAETEDLIYINAAQTNQIKTYTLSVNFRGGNEIRASTPVEVRSSARTQVGFGPNLTVGNSLNAARVASVVGLSYSGYSFSKTVDSQAGSFKVDFSSLIQERLRLNLQIIDWNGNVIRTRNYRQGNRWDITTHDINYTVEVSRQLESEYLNTTLSGTDGLPFLSNRQIRERTLAELLGNEQKRLPPVELITEEGDVDPLIPPWDVRKLRTIDMNFDFSGPRKTLKKTTTRNGQPFIEEVFTYGLAYLAQDIRNMEAETSTADTTIPALKSDSPQDWWQLIEYQKTEYIYEPANVRATVFARDGQGRNIQVRYEGGGRIFNTLYLTSIRTSGWKLSRFQQEQFDEFGTDQNALDSRWLTDEIQFLSGSTDPDDQKELEYVTAQLDSITFRRIPFRSRTQYILEPVDNIYDDVEQTPFQTQSVSRSSLGLSGEGEVIIATPDPNYAYPMKMLEERTLVQSFAQMDHPQNIFIREDREEILADPNLSQEEKTEELKDLKLLPSLTTGEDTFRSVIRKPIPSKNTKGIYGRNSKQKEDLYSEFESNASHNDHNFQYSLQEKTFKTVTGQLPDATVFNFNFEDTDNDNEQDEFEYRISSTNRSDVPLSADSLQYDTNNLSRAISAARCELELENFLSATDININLAWFYPSIRPGDYLNVIDDGSKRDLRVKNVSFQIDYQGSVGGEIIKTCSGTQLTCAIMPTKAISSRRVRKDSNSDLEIRTVIRGQRRLGQSVVPDLQTRRNPSGDILEEETGRRL